MKLTKQYAIIKWLSRLIDQGYALEEALSLLALIEGREMKRLKSLLDQGIPLHEACKRMHFKSYGFELLSIGMESNQLSESLHLLLKRFHFDLSIEKQRREMLNYPLMLFLFSLIGFEWLRLKLFPALERLREAFPVEQDPRVTFFAFHLLKIIFLIVCAIFVVNKVFPRLINCVRLTKQFRSLVFCHHLNLLISTGCSLEEAFQKLSKTLNRNVYQTEGLINHILNETKLHRLSSFDQGYVQALRLGLMSNRLSEQLQDYELLYEEIIQGKMKQLAQFLQFGVFIVVAVNILLIYFVMIIPLFQMSNYF